MTDDEVQTELKDLMTIASGPDRYRYSSTWVVVRAIRLTVVLLLDIRRKVARAD